MIPKPFVTSVNPFSDDLQERLALPVHKPWVKTRPLFPPVLQPMPTLEDLPRVKGYFLGGLLGYGRPSEEELESYRSGDHDKAPSFADRVRSFANDNKDFFQSVYDMYRK